MGQDTVNSKNASTTPTALAPGCSR
jgi:hypothetical protein